MDGLEISPEELSRIEEHAVADVPVECCGMMLGRLEAGRVRVESVLSAANVAPDPAAGYAIEPAALVTAQRTARAEGLEIVGYYHSHPGGRAVPSQRDHDDAWPETSYLIVGLTHGVPTERRSWRLGRAGRFEEQTVVVAEGAVATGGRR